MGSGEGGWGAVRVVGAVEAVRAAVPVGVLEKRKACEGGWGR